MTIAGTDMEPSRVFLVGAGPGDPGLITQRGLSLLRGADVVIADALVNPELLLEAPPDAVVHKLPRGPGLSAENRRLAMDIMVETAKPGNTVVRLKGGDPFVFGRIMEEVGALEEAGIPFEIVPGVSSAFSVPAMAGIPLTDRNMASSVLVVTGRSAPGRQPVDFRALAKTADTLVVLMGLGRVGEIVDALMEGGLSPDTPSAAISWGSFVDQRTVETTLGELAVNVAKSKLTTPGILVVGAVVELRGKLAYFEKRPLFGRKVVVTRARAQSHGFVEKLLDLGAKPLLFPTIKISPTPLEKEGLDLLRRVGDFDGVFFTSANSVRRCFEELEGLGLDARVFADTRIIAVGKITAETLKSYGLRADCVPERFSQEGILQALGAEDIEGRSFLFPRARRAQETLSRLISERGGSLSSLILYDTVKNDLSPNQWPEELKEGNFDFVTFMSPSSVRGFQEILGKKEARKILSSSKIVAIGKTTAGALAKMGFENALVPVQSTVDDILNLLISHRDDPEERTAPSPVDSEAKDG